MLAKLNKWTYCFVLIDDKKKEYYTKTYYKYNKAELEKRNKNWWGVYFAVNDFSATQAEMDERKVKTQRNIPFLKKLNAVFADLDIAKAWDKQTREDKQIGKEKIMKWLMDYCEPTYIIDTSNWLQPLWVLDEDKVDEATQVRYVNVINWIIERSKTVGGAGDHVKDVTRVIRLPGFDHMKEEPYPITKIHETDNVFTIDSLEEKFLKFCPKEVERKQDYNTKQYDTTRQYKEIERLDFKEVIMAAFGSVWRSCDFDKKDRLVIDWRLSGTFIWKHGDRRYLASTSHEPFKWNVITSVADIQRTSNKEAYMWIIDTFNIII